MAIGSRAWCCSPLVPRGDALEVSDFAVFLESMTDYRSEINRLADLRVDFLDATGAFFDTKPYPAAACQERTPLTHEIRRDGRDL
nr:hypothetical protein [uncultured Rhodopila sp.]